MIKDFLRIFEIITGIIWFLLGILIMIWLIIPLEILELILWIGFAIGCMFTGITTILNSSKTGK